MHTAKIESQAFKAAQQAKPGILKHNGKVYTMVFDHNQWVYNVFEDGFWLVNFNTKKITQCKKFLLEYLNS
jgi:hypothetical protein